MAEERQFGPDDLRQVQQALALAEELTGRFYCIPGREWPRYPYDVRTRADGPGPDPPAFADVIRVVTEPRRGNGPFYPERFRIRLRDDTILAAVHDREDGVELAPLLLYVLTHELVHVIRFGGEFAPFEAPLEQRLREEDKVHAITSRILEPVTDDGLRKVAALYSGALLEAQAASDAGPVPSRRPGAPLSSQNDSGAASPK